MNLLGGIGEDFCLTAVQNGAIGSRNAGFSRAKGHFARHLGMLKNSDLE
jgi:hypothetical protein